MKWLSNNTIQIEPPKKPKKITGTRFATILGLNPWATPFEVWCEITKTYQKPFEDTIYTIAGKTIEPKQAQYIKNKYFIVDLQSPTDVFGEDYFNKTHGDFFPNNSIFGGMWDYKTDNLVLEMKTTKRAEDWANDIPEYYALQGALYAYLLGVDDVVMVASFLEENDYKDPNAFIPSIDNTITKQFKVSQRYPNFRSLIEEAETWWYLHVVEGVSPIYDEKKDASIIKELRTNTLNPTTDIQEVLKEAEELKAKIDELSKPIEPLEKRLKVVSDIIKNHAIEQFRDGDKQVSLRGDNTLWNISISESTQIDKEALKKDGLLDKYSKATQTYKLTTKEIK